MAVLITSLAYVMRWFGACGVGFQRISETAGSDCFKFVALLLALPCFKISNPSLQVTFFRQQRKLLALGRKCALLGGKNYGLQFNNLALNGGKVVEFQKRARYVASRLQAAYGTTNR